MRVNFQSLVTTHILTLWEYEVKKYELLFFLIVQYTQHKIVMWCKSIKPGFRISISELVSEVLFYSSVNLLISICNKYVSKQCKQSIFEDRSSKTFQCTSEKCENVTECDVYYVCQHEFVLRQLILRVHWIVWHRY